MWSLYKYIQIFKCKHFQSVYINYVHLLYFQCTRDSLTLVCINRQYIDKFSPDIEICAYVLIAIFLFPSPHHDSFHKLMQLTKYSTIDGKLHKVKLNSMHFWQTCISTSCDFSLFIENYKWFFFLKLFLQSDTQCI